MRNVTIYIIFDKAKKKKNKGTKPQQSTGFFSHQVENHVRAPNVPNNDTDFANSISTLFGKCKKNVAPWFTTSQDNAVLQSCFDKFVLEY